MSKVCDCLASDSKSSPYLHVATSEMWCWSGGRGILRKRCLFYSIVYCYNSAQRYEQFLQIGRLYRAFILIVLALYIFYLHSNFFWLHLLVNWAWWDWPLTKFINRCPSVLWHCCLGHTTHKIVSEITYNVSSGTLNPTIPYWLKILPHNHSVFLS